MSYCRFGWDGNQAYIIGTRNLKKQNLLECCGCLLSDDWYYENYGDMLRHLNDHRSAGHYISSYVDDQLWAEVEDLTERWVPVGELPDRVSMIPNPPKPEELEAFKRFKRMMDGD